MKYAVLTAAQMRMLDHFTIKTFGVPELSLMECAGKEIFRFISEYTQNFSKKNYLILVGNGNNGGDALVVARHLLNNGAKCTGLLVGDSKKMSRSARLQFKIVQNMDMKIEQYNSDKLVELMDAHDLCIDGILGTGFSGKLREQALTIIQQVNAHKIPVLAIDIPSGLNADSGKPQPDAIKAVWTITLGAYKKGLFLRAARPYVGKLRVVDIGLPLNQWLKIKR